MAPKRYFDVVEAEAGESGGHGAEIPSSSSGLPSGSTKNKATLFVSRLPFSATTTDLQTLFSDVGPLRRAFVVTDPATKASKGVGYVTFSIPEDAERALGELQGKKLDGKRPIAISWADAKPLKTAGAGDDQPAVKRPRVQVRPAANAAGAHSSVDQSSKDPDAVRTVILSGLSSCKPAADAKTLYKRARKIGDVENVVYPAIGMSGSQDSDAAHVIFRTPNHAATAVTKLHGHTFKGALLSAVLKKRADGAARLEARMKPETRERMERIRQEVAEASKASGPSAVSLPSLENIPVSGINTESRLILRNLPFDIQAADLRAVFLPFGPIFKIDIPLKSAADAKGKGKAADDDSAEASAAQAASAPGEVDVVHSSVDASEKANPNGEATLGAARPSAAASADADHRDGAPQAKGRGFAFVWMVSRADAARALEAVNGRALRHGEAEKVAAKAAKGSRGRQLARQEFQAVRDLAQPERIVAVDWALSKADWQKKENEPEPESEGGKSPLEDADAGDDESESEASDEDEEEGSDVDDDKAEKPALPTPSEGTTLFVRNLPYEATEAELLALFKQFGPVRYARITMDRSSNPPRSKGTGFVCFWNTEHAIAATKRAREVEAEAGTSKAAPAATQSNPFSMTSSVLTADPSAPLTASFNIRGRILNVVPAVEKDKAETLTAAGVKARQKQDKRNTYLMREGVPLPQTPLAEELASNENEIERRLASFAQRKNQLAINPSLFISKTRLSVRQLPLFCTDRMLKRLAIHAIKSFKSEVTDGKRQNLDADELADHTFSPASKPPKKGERATSVVQAKVVRALDRPDPLTGFGRSKGFGFLEMRTFGEAMRVLRWANANKGVQKLMLQWHMEELEDLHKQLTNASERGAGKDEEDRSSVGDRATRIKRVASRLSELKESGSGAIKSMEKAERGGLLFVEFSIENATIVKQRRDRAEQNRNNAERRKARPDADKDGPGSGDEDDDDEAEDQDEEEAHGAAGKRKRPATWNQSTKEKTRRMAREKASDKVSADAGKGKTGTVVGGMIGKKRAVKKRKEGGRR